MVRNIWERIAIWTGASCLAPANWIQTDSLQQFILHMVSGLPTATREALKSLIMLVIWEIWKERNNRVFRRISRSVHQMISAIQDEAKTWAYAGNKGMQHLLQTLQNSHPLAPSQQSVDSVVGSVAVVSSSM